MSRSNDLASLADEATGGISKAEVGLGNVDNTADSAKPVSTAQQTALDAKANKSGDIFSGNVGIGASSLTGGNVGLDIHKTGSGVGSQIRLKNQHNTGFYIGQAGDTTGEVIVWNDANTDMQFRTNGDERLRIKANGNVIVGASGNASGVGLRVSNALESSSGINSQGFSATFLNTFNNANAHGVAIGSKHADSYSLIVGGHDTAFNHFVVKGDGNVGINSTSPGQKLAIEGSASANENILRINNQSNHASRIWIRNSGRSAYISQGASTADNIATGLTAGSLSFGHSGTGGIQFWTSDTSPTQTKMTIADSGNVGIGDTSPSQMLTIKQTIDDAYTPNDYNDKSLITLHVPNAEDNYGGIRFTHAGNTEGFFGYHRESSTSDRAEFVWQGYDGNANSYKEYMRLNWQGYLGIGTTSPTRDLYVNGDSYLGGFNFLTPVTAYRITNGTATRNVKLHSSGGGECWGKLTLVGLWPYTGAGHGTVTIEFTAYMSEGRVTVIDTVKKGGGSTVTVTVTGDNANDLINFNISTTASGWRFAAFCELIYGNTQAYLTIDGTDG